MDSPQYASRMNTSYFKRLLISDIAIENKVLLIYKKKIYKIVQFVNTQWLIKYHKYIIDSNHCYLRYLEMLFLNN